MTAAAPVKDVCRKTGRREEKGERQGGWKTCAGRQGGERRKETQGGPEPALDRPEPAHKQPEPGWRQREPRVEAPGMAAARGPCRERMCQGCDQRIANDRRAMQRTQASDAEDASERCRGRKRAMQRSKRAMQPARTRSTLCGTGAAYRTQRCQARPQPGLVRLKVRRRLRPSPQSGPARRSQARRLFLRKRGTRSNY